MRITESFQRFFFLHFEWLVLSSGLVLMAFIDPADNKSTLCLFEFIGINFCPGEGFGRSIALVFRGEILESFQMHPLGLPGITIIAHRIVSIFKRNRSLTKMI
ncbi:hypothetical protein BH23BAC3_BH23BAC3_01010 [soil metagenome]